MLPKKARITKKKETEAVFKKGKSSFSDTLGVKVLPIAKEKDAKTIPISRFVVVVSKKVSKKAVDRNRIKRQLHEVIRTNSYKLAPGNNFFVLSMPKITELDFHGMEKDLLNHFKKLNALKVK